MDTEVVNSWLMNAGHAGINLIFHVITILEITGYEQRLDAGNKRTTYNFKKVAKRDEYVCQYCGYSPRYVLSVYRPMHVDHIIPFSMGGNNSMKNLVMSCAKYNETLSNKIFPSFMDKKIHIIEKYRAEGKPHTARQWMKEEIENGNNIPEHIQNRYKDH